MLSPFRRRKNALIFYRWDQTKDGLLRADDIEAWGRGVAEHLNVAQGSPDYDKIMETYRQMWTFYFKPFDKDNDDALTLDDFFGNIVAFGDAEARAQGVDYNKGLFDVLDRDGDGRIGPDEYAAFVRPLGVSEQDARTAFGQLDRDGDGSLARDEFAEDLFEYFQSDDRSARGNWFFGSA